MTIMILVFIVLDQSGTFEFKSQKIQKAGIIGVEESTMQWHPERFVPYVKEHTLKGARTLFRMLKGSSSTTTSSKKKKPSKTFDRVVLNDGTVLDGTIVEEEEQGLYFEVDGGMIFFRYDEIASYGTKN